MTALNEKMSTEAAMALFDSFPPAREDMMIGVWRGVGIDTDHPMDGLLEASYWHGKIFEGDNAVYPLVHKAPLWGQVFVNPALLPLRLVTHLPLRDMLGPILFPLLVPFIWTRKPKARLRTISFRGREHAAMCYDAKPINDVFARIDEDTVMGWMDDKHAKKPYFFKLFREG